MVEPGPLAPGRFDNCAEALAGIRSLTYLDIRGTPLSKNASELTALKTLRPKLQIITHR